jgi:hypothetical protein
MATYQQQSMTPAKGGTDIAAWGIIAIIVAVICAAAGWAFARQQAPSRNDLVRAEILSSRSGAVNGERSGYNDGFANGRSIAKAKAAAQVQLAKRSAQAEGWTAGYAAGQARAEARANGGDALMLGSMGAMTSPYTSADILSSGLFDDAPGYSDSAYSTYGYGSTALTPDAASGVTSSSSSSELLGY